MTARDRKIAITAVVVGGGLLTVLLLAWVAADRSPSPAVRTGEAEPTTPGSTSMSSSTDGAVPEVTVKFREGSAVRTRDNRFVTERSDDLSPLQAVLEKYPGLRIERTFERPEAELAREKSTLEAQTGQPQPDLNLYFRLVLPNGTDVNAVVAELNRLAIVQTAYLAPTAVPPP